MIIAKQMEVRANIREYLDMAYKGEQIMIPRKNNKNVVIISEQEYNRLTLAKRMTAYSNVLAPPQPPNPPSMQKPEKICDDNIRKLQVIRNLKDNWNGNGAPAFEEKFMEKITGLIKSLEIQPEIFPTALSTIQLEYDNSRHDHMEIEIGASDTAEIFIVTYFGTESFEDIEASSDSINKRVREFYG